MTWCSDVYKASVELLWSPFSSINTPISFPITTLFMHYPGFPGCFLPKHLYGPLLLFFSFLAQVNHQRSFPGAQFLRQVSQPLLFSISSPGLSSNITLIWFIVLLFLSLHYSVWSLRGDKMSVLLTAIFPIHGEYDKIGILCFVCSEECIFLLISHCSLWVSRPNINFPHWRGSWVLCVFQFLHSPTPYIFDVILPIASQWVL